MKGFIYAPEGRLKHRYVTPDRWPHQGMWIWDSAFQAIGLRHADPDTAWDAVAAVLDAQREDGFVSICYRHDGYCDETQPPTLAMAARLIHGTAPDRDRIAGMFPKLEAYLEWDMQNRDTDGAGLVEWQGSGAIHGADAVKAAGTTVRAGTARCRWMRSTSIPSWPASAKRWPSSRNCSGGLTINGNGRSTMNVCAG